MKKIIIIISVCLLCCGCNNNSNNKQDKIKQPTNKNQIKEEYIDLNNTPIGIYKLDGHKLTKLQNFNTTLSIEKEIGTFQIFPSNENTIYLNNNFGESFYNEWIKYNIKLGFNIKFTLSNGENISYNILSPENTFDKWEYLMNYLYDDYANRGKSFYSHIESKDVTESTLFTSFKMQSSYSCDEILSDIKLSVFTYDSEDDFKDNEYRGNSIYTLNIINNK